VGAGISPKERLERIEAMLSGIDKKLDGKADVAIVIAMETRLSLLEKAQIEQRMLQRANEEKVLEARTLAEALRVESAQITRRVAYAGGAVAAAVFLGEIAIRVFTW
jgi:hypothetical protein